MKHTILVISFLMMWISAIDAQTFTVGAKFFGISFHPHGAANANLMPRKYDRDGMFVQNLGMTMNFEYYVMSNIISVKYVQGAYLDCLSQFAGFTHIGLRGRIFQSGKHSLNGGFGPTLLFRRNWYHVPGYDDSFAFFHGAKEDYWQHRFIWYGGEMEYNYALHDRIDLSVTFVPGYPDLMNLSFGIRYRSKS